MWYIVFYIMCYVCTMLLVLLVLCQKWRNKTVIYWYHWVFFKFQVSLGKLLNKTIDMVVIWEARSPSERHSIGLNSDSIKNPESYDPTDYDVHNKYILYNLCIGVMWNKHCCQGIAGCPGLILGLRQANERRRYFVSLESVLISTNDWQ